MKTRPGTHLIVVKNSLRISRPFAYLITYVRHGVNISRDACRSSMPVIYALLTADRTSKVGKSEDNTATLNLIDLDQLREKSMSRDL